MCIHVYIYIYIYMHTHTYTHTHLYWKYTLLLHIAHVLPIVGDDSLLCLLSVGVSHVCRVCSLGFVVCA